MQWYEILTNDEVRRIHEAALRVLEEIGLELEHPEVKKLLQERGTKVEDKRVKLPASFVEDMLNKVPRRFSVFKRDGSGSLTIGGDEIHTVPGRGIPNVLDPVTGERRENTRRDIEEAAKIMDACPHVHIATPIGPPREVPPEMESASFYVSALRNTTKPLCGINVEAGAEVKYIAEMASMVSGGMQALREKPTLMFGLSCVSPLKFSNDLVDAIVEIAKVGVPLRILPCPVMAAGAPTTLAGGLVQQHAENLGTMAIAYMVTPGLPVVFYCRLSVLDMRRGTSTWGAPEVGLTSMGYAQLCRHYGIPSNVYALGISSKAFDEQAGYEKGGLLLMSALAGANMLAGVGNMDEQVTWSREQIVIDDELCGWMFRVLKAFQVNDDTLAVDVIREVVASGDPFLAHPHTRKYFRAGENWMPQISERRVYEEWETAGKKDITQKASERVQEILSKHEVMPLDESLDREIDRTLAKAQQALGETLSRWR